MAKKTQGELKTLQNKIQTLMQFTTGLINRAKLSTLLGYQYGGDRDVYEALGYKKTLSFEDYFNQYLRQDIAKAIIDRPISATWRGELTLLESDDEKDTAFEKDWKELDRKLKIKSNLARLDRLTGLGRYGVLLFGLDDVQKQEDFERPVRAGKRRLLYIKPLSEKSIKIHKWEMNANNDRYGLPTIYKLSMSAPATAGGAESEITISVHHSRVVHVPGQLMESEVYGLPRLEAVFNRLKDLEKIVGGSAEMFWRGARPGYQGKVDKDFQIDDDTKEALQTQIDEYEHNLRRFLINEGIDLKELGTQVSDPQNHVDIQIQMIAAVTGIPKRILTGSELGELASGQDRSNWLDFVQERREEYAEPYIIRPFVDKCIEYGCLSKPKEKYSIVWPDLWSASEKEKAEIGKTRAEALKSYADSLGAADLIPAEVFTKFFLGFSDDTVELINEARGAIIAEEDRDFDNAGGD